MERGPFVIQPPLVVSESVFYAADVRAARSARGRKQLPLDMQALEGMHEFVARGMGEYAAATPFLDRAEGNSRKAKQERLVKNYRAWRDRVSRSAERK